MKQNLCNGNELQKAIWQFNNNTMKRLERKQKK